MIGMPHSKGFAHRKDERTLKATRIGDVVDGLLPEPSTLVLDVSAGTVAARGA